MSERDVFTAARELTDPAARAAYLDGACGDPGLRSRVEALLRAHDQPDSLLDHPAVAAHDLDPDATQALTGTPEPAVSASQTAAGENTSADDEALSFLAPPGRPDSLGRIGHYEVLQVLGRGGFGIVFRAFDEVLHRVVAVKVLAPQLAATSPARKRFLREARSSAQVRHENVVQVYEVGEQPLPYIAMEFIPGETLQQRLDRVGPVEPAEVVRVGRQIAEGLAAAHAQDLIHRDIKPGNILLEGGAGRVRITDFGLARAADDASISQSGIIAGTPMYMAPEQAKGEKLDQRADLFSLGSVLYQMAAGRPPFRANSAVAVLKRVAEDTPRDIREIIPETPQWLCDIIAKLHAKEPADRFQSAREVADLLADCEAQLKANSRLKDFSRIPRGKARPSGRRKGFAAAAAVLLPVIAVVVTEFAGLTHLFPGRPGTSDANKSGTTRPSWNGWPADAPPPAIAPFDAGQAHAHQEAWAKYLGVPVEYTNSIGMKFRLIPPGQFIMGTSADQLNDLLEQARRAEGVMKHELLALAKEGAPRPVRLTRPYYVGVSEVTRTQFEQFVAASGYRTELETSGTGGYANFQGKWVSRPEHVWRTPGEWQPDPNEPVVHVTPGDAEHFCDWLGRREGVRYALPTDAQWEFACRAGTTEATYAADGQRLVDIAWTSESLGDFRTAPETHRPRVVGQKLPNPFGLYDMLGNVWEFTTDTYAPGPTTSDPQTDPTGPPRGNTCVLRGGGWYRPGNLFARSAARSLWERRYGDCGVGFRVVIVGDLNAKMPPVAVAPFTDADVQRIAALPATEQVEEVRKELMRRNLGFDGKMEHKIKDGVVTEIHVVTDNVTDISPLRVFNALRVLDCSGTQDPTNLGARAQLADLGHTTGTQLEL